ncbi:Secretory lipase family protein [Mycobacterium sp. MFM001]|nr:Secretory lipase family protein [Mycobacterium sp. MFM001]
MGSNLAGTISATTSVAGADESVYAEFYTPPDPLPPGRPGDLIRTEPSRIVLEPSGQLGAYVASATRIMYRSTDPHGQPIAVTGTYFEPDNPWPGGGPRPLIAYGVGTHGLGDQCAPSRLFNQGIHFSSGLDLMLEYEETFIATMVARGFAIVVTDYEGLGTPGVHTFGNRLAQGYALIDAARAAKHLTGTSLNPDGPVAFWGYSQGGTAAGSAAELAPAYAPELHLVGAFVGAPPSDSAATFPYVDGNVLAGITGLVLNGLIAAYPELSQPIHDRLTPQGEDLVSRTQNMCVAEMFLTFAFHRTQEYFTVSPDELAETEPIRTALQAQKLGTLQPAIPLFIDQNRWDPLVPWHQAHQVALDWCAKGADVQFWTNEQPPFLNKLSVNHLLTSYVDGERSMQWIADRFNGLPTTPNCTEL